MPSATASSSRQRSSAAKRAVGSSAKRAARSATVACAASASATVAAVPSTDETADDAALCDPRIARSRQALRDAFIELLTECGLDGFTVNDLCRAAGLNRGTFYNHFHDKEAFLAALEDEVIAELGGFKAKMSSLEIKDLLFYKARKKPLPVLVELFDSLREHGVFLRAVLGPGGDASFSRRISATVCDDFVRTLLHERYRNDSSPLVKYYVAYYAGAYLGVIQAWIEDGMQESSEDMALIAMRLFFIKPGESIRM